MIFSTYRFIFLFLPVTFFGYFILNRFRYYSVAKIWLIIASLYFYGQGSPAFFPFFLASITGNYIIGTAMTRMEGSQTIQRKILLGIGLAGNIGLLGYYKYTDFFIENYNLLTGSDYALKHIVLPIGISFFTFQLIAFLVDSYRGETKQYDIINYLLFITFFPQLIVGPIIHHGEIVPQFEDERNLKLNYDNLAKGLFLFSIGCAKKILLADPMTTNAQSFFNSVPSNPDLLLTWFSSIEYTISYYFDLSGYADMAIGLGHFFGFHFLENFNYPYESRSVTEFWRRWHISLSTWFREYVYIPLGGNRKGKGRQLVNIAIVWLLTGLWHGASWNFVLWGVYYAVLLLLEKTFLLKWLD